MWLMWPSFVWSERLLARHESQDHAVAWIQDAAAQKPKTTAKLQRDQYEVYLTHLEFSTWKAAFLDLLALSLADTWTCTWAEVQANVPTAKSDTSNFQHRPQITPLFTVESVDHFCAMLRRIPWPRQVHVGLPQELWSWRANFKGSQFTSYIY